jgi:hypothetical protein
MKKIILAAFFAIIMPLSVVSIASASPMTSVGNNCSNDAYPGGVGEYREQLCGKAIGTKLYLNSAVWSMTGQTSYSSWSGSIHWLASYGSVKNRLIANSGSFTITNGAIEGPYNTPLNFLFPSKGTLTELAVGAHGFPTLAPNTFSIHS